MVRDGTRCSGLSVTSQARPEVDSSSWVKPPSGCPVFLEKVMHSTPETQAVVAAGGWMQAERVLV